MNAQTETAAGESAPFAAKPIWQQLAELREQHFPGVMENGLLRLTNEQRILHAAACLLEADAPADLLEAAIAMLPYLEKMEESLSVARLSPEVIALHTVVRKARAAIARATEG